MDRYHLNFLLVDPCPLAGTQFMHYAEGLGQTAVQLFSAGGLSVEGVTPVPNAVIYAWQAGNEGASQAELALLQQRFRDVPLVVSTKPEGLTAVAQLKNIHSYILYPYVSDDVERLVEQIHQREVSKRANDLHPLLAEMVMNPDEPITLQRLTDLLVNRFGYDIAMCHVIQPLDDCLRRQTQMGLVAKEGIAATASFRLGEGMIGRVAESAEPAIVFDLHAQPDFHLLDLIIYEGASSMLAVPLQLRQDVLGVFSCFSRTPHHFTSSELAFLTNLANLAVLELNNAQQQERWQVLEKVGHSLITVQHLRDAIRITAEQALAIAEASGVNVCFYSSDQGHFLSDYQKGAGVGQAVVHWSGREPEWEIVLGKVLRDGVYPVSDISTWHEFPTIQKALKRLGIGSFVGLCLQGHVLNVGAMFVFYRRSHPVTTIEQFQATGKPLAIYAEMAGLVIDRAYHQERQILETAIVHQWTEMTSTGLPQHGVDGRLWNGLLKQVLMATGADRGAISLQVEGENWRHYCQGVPKAYIERQVLFKGRSLERAAAQSEQSIIALDLQHLSLSESSYLLRDVKGSNWEMAAYGGAVLPRSRIVTPIRKGHDLMGLVILESGQPNTFNQHDAALLNNLTHHISVALSRDILTRKLGESVQKFPVVQLIRSDLEDMLDKVRADVGCDVATLFLYSPYWETFQLPMSSGHLRFANTAFGFDPKQLQPLVSAKPDGLLITNMDLIRPAFPLFVERERIQSACAVCLKNGRSETIGILILHCRDDRQVSQSNQMVILQAARQMEDSIERAYYFPQLVEILRDTFKFDLVRLHLYKETETKWSLPMTAGTILQPVRWKQQRQDDPVAITRALAAVKNGEKPYRFINNVTTDPILRKGNFVERERIRSGGYVLLQVGDEVVGILFVNWRTPHIWTEAEKNAVLLFAREAAVGIYNRRLITQLKEEGVHSNWIQRIVGAIIEAGFNREAVLDVILEQAIALTHAHFGVIRLIDEQDFNWVNTVAVSGIQIDKESWLQVHGRVHRQDKGISLLALRRNKRVFATNVLAPEYEGVYVDAVQGNTLSEIAVVLRHMQTGKPIGVIDVEHPEIGGFGEQALELLTTFAEVVSIVLHNMEKDANATQTREELAHLESLAWRGLFGSSWWHAACQKTSSIKAYIVALRDLVADNAMALDGLQEIMMLVDKIEDIPREGWLPGELEMEPEPLAVDALVETAVTEACRPYPNIHVSWQLKSAAANIAVHPKLFSLALKNLIDNAIRAMNRRGKLKIRLVPQGKEIEIHLMDTGPGIPTHIQPYFFRHHIPPKANPEGSGMGAYMANFVFRRYRGNADVVRSDKTGTHLKITLPIAQQTPYDTASPANE